MLKIVTINVRGLYSPRKHHVVLNELKRLSSDVYFIRETHINTVSRANMIVNCEKANVFGRNIFEWTNVVTDYQLLLWLRQTNSFIKECCIW